MNEENFVRQIILLYRNARKSKFADRKIRRGRSHAIASLTEDLFAKFLITKVGADLIYIDQPISIEGFKAQYYPDITIIKNNAVAAFCDLKMDIGWNRKGLYDLCENHNKWLETARGKSCKIRDGETKTDYSYRISKRATYNVVLITDRNVNKKLFAKLVEGSKKFNPEVEVFIMTSGQHPNEYGISVEGVMEKIRIHKKAFEELTQKLKKNA